MTKPPSHAQHFFGKALYFLFFFALFYLVKTDPFEQFEARTLKTLYLNEQIDSLLDRSPAAQALHFSSAPLPGLPEKWFPVWSWVAVLKSDLGLEFTLISKKELETLLAEPDSESDIQIQAHRIYPLLYQPEKKQLAVLDAYLRIEFKQPNQAQWIEKNYLLKYVRDELGASLFQVSDPADVVTLFIALQTDVRIRRITPQLHTVATELDLR